MRYLIFLGLCVLLSSYFFREDASKHPIVSQNNISKGEELEYRLNFGFITVGKAQMKVYPGTYRVNGRGCYRMDIFGQTSGAVDWVAKVDDNWGAYVDTLSLVPHIAYRKIKENKHRKHEIVNFDRNTNTIEVMVKDKHTGEFKEPSYFKAPEDIRDLVGGYMYLRTLDYSKYRKGDIIVVDAFFEDQIYDFAIRYEGKEEVKLKLGKFTAIKLVPVMPDNKLFSGKDAITVWFSDDINKVPLKIKANMAVGHAECELISYKGLKGNLNGAKTLQQGGSY